MLTVILCVIGILIICAMWWKTENGRLAAFGWFLVVMLFMFGMIFPIAYPSNITNQVVVKEYEVTEIDGNFYYLSGGDWEDITNILNIYQSNELSVVEKKPPESIWYWPINTIEAHIPIVKEKD